MQAIGRDHDELAYRAFAPELIRFASALVGPTDASDVFSTAFLKALSARSWPTVSNRRAYLYRAVLNEAKTWKRRAAQRGRAETLGITSRYSELPELRPEVRDAVERLSIQQRAVILLTYWSDLQPAAVGELLGISEGAVRRYLVRARAQLRKVLDG